MTDRFDPEQYIRDALRYLMVTPVRRVYQVTFRGFLLHVLSGHFPVTDR